MVMPRIWLVLLLAPSITLTDRRCGKPSAGPRQLNIFYQNRLSELPIFAVTLAWRMLNTWTIRWKDRHRLLRVKEKAYCSTRVNCLLSIAHTAEHKLWHNVRCILLATHAASSSSNMQFHTFHGSHVPSLHLVTTQSCASCPSESPLGLYPPSLSRTAKTAQPSASLNRLSPQDTDQLLD